MNAASISGIVTTGLVHAGVIAALIWFADSDSTGTEPPKITALTAIEASLAYKSADETSAQPQKRGRRNQRKQMRQQKRVRQSGQKPSTQAGKAPDRTGKKPVRRTSEEDYASRVDEFIKRRQTSEDEEDDFIENEPEGDALPERTASTAFDGSAHGFAEVNKGHPYMQQLAADAYKGWRVPTLERGEGDAVGCVRLGTNGRILDTQLLQTTENANIDRSVKLALEQLSKRRRRTAKPVPADLIEATKQWICFKFSV